MFSADRALYPIGRKVGFIAYFSQDALINAALFLIIAFLVAGFRNFVVNMLIY